MGLFGRVASGVASELLDSAGTTAKDLREAITGEEAQRKLVALEQSVALAKVDLAAREAQHPSVFVAGWRPALGWSIALRLLYIGFLQPLLVGVGVPAPEIVVDESTQAMISEVVHSMLGVFAVGARSWEKGRGVQDRH